MQLLLLLLLLLLMLLHGVGGDEDIVIDARLEKERVGPRMGLSCVRKSQDDGAKDRIFRFYLLA